MDKKKLKTSMEGCAQLKLRRGNNMGQKIIAGLIGAAALSPFWNIYVSAFGFILAWINFSDFIREPRTYQVQNG